MTAENAEIHDAWEDADAEEARLALLNRERGARVLRRWGAAVVVILLVHTPMLYLMGQFLWKRPHYQAFPMIIAGFAWLVWMRLPIIQWPEETDFSVRKWLMLSAGAVAFSAAILLVSPWFGLLSCLIMLWGSAWYFGGPSAVYELRAPFVFLSLLMPLPLGLDVSLIVTLQRWATATASQGLELMGVLHTISGVAIRTATKSYMVEEACSGVHSLFTAVSAMLFFCIYCRYSWFRSLIIIVMTVFWVVIANGLRVFALVYCDARFQWPLDTGWQHEVVGLCTYAIAMLLILSTDQFLRFVFPVMTEELVDIQLDFDERVRAPMQEFMFGLLDRPRLVGPMAVVAPAVMFAVIFVCGGIAAARTLFDSADRAKSPAVVTQRDSEMRKVSKDTLPENINGWKLTGVDEIVRDSDDPFGGLRSSQWFYSGHGLNVIVSLDGYYDDWHRLADCYIGLGWVVEDSKNQSDVQSFPNGEESAIWHTEYQMYRDDFRRGIVLFSCFDSQLTSVVPPPVEDKVRISLKERLQAVLGRQKTVAGYRPPVFQVQLLVEAEREIQPHEQKALLQMFREARSQLLSQVAGGQE